MANEIITISDIHFGSGHSVLVGETLEFLKFQFQSVPAVVINGDFFDILQMNGKIRTDGMLDNSKLEDRVTSLISKHLYPIIRDCPNTEFYFIRGNHEALPVFDQELNKLAANKSNFHFYDECMVLSGGLFIHGHTVMGNADQTEFGGISRRKSGNSSLITKILPEEKDIYERMCENIRAREDLQGLNFDRVFVGHTHVPALEIAYPDMALTVHNTGAFWQYKTPCVMRLACNEDWTNIDSVKEIKTPQLNVESMALA